jgi:uncharacterized protein (AIM24 family)
VLVSRAERGISLRLENTLATIGDLAFVPEMKRFRGRAADTTFGPPGTPIFRVTGNGMLVNGAGAGQFLVLVLKDDIVYLREELVFGFDGQVVWENGRIPQRSGEEVPLVHFRGKGRLVLQLKGGLRALKVEPERSAWVALPGLVGWFGRIVPKVVQREGVGDSVRWVECIGEGTLLLDAQAAAEAHEAVPAAVPVEAILDEPGGAPHESGG